MSSGIVRRSRRELDIMREAGRIVAEVLDLLGSMIRPDLTTMEMDRAAFDLIIARGGIATFKDYAPPGMIPYPGHICVSINEEVVHGIPGPRKLKEGDLVSVDVGVTYRGFVGDAARTYIVGQAGRRETELVEVCRISLEKVVEIMRPGISVSDISTCVQTYVEQNGFSVVRDYTGHGVGHEMHLSPEVPNFVGSRFSRQNQPLQPGVVLAVEPMVNAGTYKVKTLKDRWTVVTADGQPSAHFEYSIAIVEGGCEVLTKI